MTPDSRENPHDEARLDSWKEIAAYLQRDVTTAIRWEKKEALPVHRHHHLSRSSVYAYPSELDAWRANRRPLPAARRYTWWRPAPAFACSTVIALSLVMAGSGPRGGSLLQAADGIVTRQVWRDTGVGPDVAPSPDSRYLAFADNETGDLAVRDLKTGQSRRLTQKAGGRENWDSAISPVFSPDGMQVAFGWRTEKPEWTSELRVVGLDGSNPRVIDPGTTHGVFPMDWSRDGGYILALLLKDLKVAAVSVADGSVKVLKTIDWPWSVPGTANPDVMRFSPDGRFVAYDRPADEAGNRDVYMFSVATGEVIPLVQHPAQDRMLGWAPDGRSLLFLSDRTGSWGAWLVEIANGKPAGAPRLVKRDTGVIRPLGFARGGSFYYRVHDVGANVYTAALDSMTPSLLVQRYLGANHRPVWSPDGKRILYISDRPPGRTLVIRRLETGEEQEYSPSLPIIINPQWSPDGKSVLLNGADAQRRRAGWYLFDIEKRQLTPALLGKGALVSAPLSADGAAVYYIEPRDENAKRPARIMRRDLRTGQDKEVRVLPGDVRWGEQVHASPDGRWLALLETSARGDWWNFAVLPLGGGEIRELPGPWTDVKPWKITWAPDSQQLVFVRPAMGGGKQIRSEFWGVPVDGGEQRRLGFSVPKNVMNLSVHPDGKQLAFTTREEVTEIWAMENFLPASRETSFR